MLKSIGKLSADNEGVDQYNGEYKTENLHERSDNFFAKL
jgi:hypothetical protein